MGFTCNFAPTGQYEGETYEIGLGLCSGLLSLDTKSNKKSSTSTAAFSFWVNDDDIDSLIGDAFVDDNPAAEINGNSTSTDKETKTKITPKLNSLSEIEALYPIVTATNGAWPKPETVKDFSVRLVSLFVWARKSKQSLLLSYFCSNLFTDFSLINKHFIGRG
jgi:hypothetical protein